MTEGPLRTFFLLLSLAASPLQKATGARLPPGHDTPPQAAAYITTRHRDEWGSWRCGLVKSMVRQVTEEARAIKPTVQINLHLVPWRRDDFAGALRAVAGQDLAAMSAHADAPVRAPTGSHP